MTVKPKYDTFVMHEDIEREMERLRSFGIDADVEMFSLSQLGVDELDYKAIAWFGRRDGVWTVRVTPDAHVDEHWDVLSRIWDAITHPGHRLWDGHDFGTCLIVGAENSLTRINTEGGAWRGDFEKMLSEKVADLIRREFRKMTTESAAYRWLPFQAPHDLPARERFVHQRVLDSHAEEIAAEIRAEMARQQRRVEDLASALDLSVPTVRKSLKGTRPIRPRELKAICDWLDVDVEDLIAKPYREAERAGLIFDPAEVDQ